MAKATKAAARDDSAGTANGRRLGLFLGAFWVLVQHQEVSVVQADERPDTTVEAGQRAIEVRGPFRDESKAKAVRDDLASRTLRVQAEGSW